MEVLKSLEIHKQGTIESTRLDHNSEEDGQVGCCLEDPDQIGMITIVHNPLLTQTCTKNHMQIPYKQGGGEVILNRRMIIHTQVAGGNLSNEPVLTHE